MRPCFSNGRKSFFQSLRSYFTVGCGENSVWEEDPPAGWTRLQQLHGWHQTRGAPKHARQEGTIPAPVAPINHAWSLAREDDITQCMTRSAKDICCCCCCLCSRVNALVGCCEIRDWRHLTCCVSVIWVKKDWKFISILPEGKFVKVLERCVVADIVLQLDHG